MYYCAVHQVAYVEPKQWPGHWLHAHPGEPRPKAAEVWAKVETAEKTAKGETSKNQNGGDGGDGEEE